LDVHKEKISACILWQGDSDREQEEIREFGAFTDDLLEMKE
jgi:hypothetical protein